ncbi:hypothetical protein T4D_13504 [Trichinella pseudospiralis]|uniref:Uncharacterized protein n=1 Tax=Trichinella pseudospiralis TaxID=6337 RepID=A0A0V1FS06_TRIPS|nr:hypothetical protein T4D_13504 [Trichinella pseudospiralis]
MTHLQNRLAVNIRNGSDPEANLKSVLELPQTISWKIEHCLHQWVDGEPIVQKMQDCLSALRVRKVNDLL